MGRVLTLTLMLVALVFNSLSADVCAPLETCTDCTTTASLPNCGYCIGSGVCGSGTTTGPSDWSCTSGWLFPDSKVNSQSTTSGSPISPNNFNVYLRKGRAKAITLKLTPQVVPLDLYILEDMSNSFKDDITTLSSTMSTIINDVRTKLQANSWFGVGGFLERAMAPMGFTDGCNDASTDVFSGGCYSIPFQPHQVLTSDATAVKNKLTYLTGRTFGNSDSSEDLLDGMAMAAVCQTQVGWREGARHIMLISTDAGYHSRGDMWLAGANPYNNMDCKLERRAAYTAQSYYNAPPGSGEDSPSIGQVKKILIEKNIIPVFAIVRTTSSSHRPDPYPFYQELLNQLGFGYIAELANGSGNLYTVIANAYNSVSRKATLVVSSDPYNLVTSISPATYDPVNTGTQYTFTVNLLAGESSVSSTISLKIMGFGDVTIAVTVGETCDCGIPCASPTCSGHGICDCGECICDYPYGGPSCACRDDVACPQDCNGRGTCTCGVCTCSAGWTGSSCGCSTAACPGTTPCSGHGTCSCGACTCNTGWSGTDCSCSTATCPGTPSQCSGRWHGECLCGTCFCEPGWKGTDCSCADVACPNACSGHGTCQCGGTCLCNAGYTGPFCDCDMTVACPSTAKGYCDGHGTCTCSGMCQCDPGWGGTNCACSTLPCPNACSGHGTCTCGVCTCTAGYSGSDCNCPTAAPCPAPGGKTCSAHGSCVCGACDCDPYYTGADCSCLNVPCPDNCFSEQGHGTCSCGKCTCNSPWSGENCGCNDAATCPSTTNGVCDGIAHGKCQCGACVCEEGWSGSTCSCSTATCEANCFNYLGHGECVCGQCECVTGYSPDDYCSCHESSSCPNSCTDAEHGECKCDTCACKASWGGDDCSCSMLPCPGDGLCSSPYGECVCGECVCAEYYDGLECECDKRIKCPKNCTDVEHGTCGCNGICDCKPGWSGEDCSCMDTPCLDNCNGHGTCTCGVCYCNAGWKGDECQCEESLTCPNDCSGHGECECGECTCESGWGDEDCSCDQLPCAGDCNGHGTCDCHECNCATGFAGYDCMCDTSRTCGDCVNGFCCTEDSLGEEGCEPELCGQCVCQGGWGGESCDCSLTPCPEGCFNSVGHGNCVCGECECNPPYSESVNCECEDKPCLNNCAGHGTCKCGECTCEGGWVHRNETYKDCSCSTFPCPSDCTDPTHGTCVCGTCQCKEGWGGNNCNCTTAGCPNDCTDSEHGMCCNPETLALGLCQMEQCGQCICKKGYAHPEEAEDCSCSERRCPNDCNGNGKCVCGVCVCDAESNMAGPDCACDTTLVCPDDCNAANGQGTCCNATAIANGDVRCTSALCGTCMCNNGWGLGDDNACSCSPEPCERNCNGNGTCVCGKCECDEGFTGPSCLCRTDNVCLCEDEANCCTLDRIGLLPNCKEQNCNECLCPGGFSGIHCNCSTNKCPLGSNKQVCSGQGDCVCGECVCDAGFVHSPLRKDCGCMEIPDCSMYRNCSGHGSCVCTKCVCQEGWKGKDCDQCVDTPTRKCKEDDPCENALSCSDCFKQTVTHSSNCTFCAGVCVSHGKSSECFTKEDQCPTTINVEAVAVFSGIVLTGVIGMGVGAAVLFRIAQKARERREWRAFEESQKSMKFAAGENELYTTKDGGASDPRARDRKNVNPLFQ